jgi:hypothetical protein
MAADKAFVIITFRLNFVLTRRKRLRCAFKVSRFRDEDIFL